jgi:hypothetical protein
MANIRSGKFGNLLNSSIALLFAVFIIVVVAIDTDDIVVDAYAGASTTAPVVVATPNISLSTPSGSPAIITNGNQKSIQAVVGNPVTINVNTSDPNGYNGFVIAGATQNNLFYYNANAYLIVQGGNLYTKTPSTTLLPSGSTLSNKVNSVNNNTQTAFTWTPTQADTNTSVAVSFIATNYYYPNSPVSRTQTVTINTVDTTTPSFSMNAEQTLVMGVAVQIPVTVIPDSDGDNVLISASNLPAGAVLGAAAKNASGQWVAVLTWTPTAAQIGSNIITFVAQDVGETNVASNQVTFIVQNNTHPAFAASMPTQVTAAQNTELTYKVTVIPDGQTNKVLLTTTGLPSGATMSTPVLQNGQLVSTLSWVPEASQIGSHFPVTFTAEDNVAGAIPVMFTTTFAVQPHYSVINSRPVKH